MSDTLEFQPHPQINYDPAIMKFETRKGLYTCSDTETSKKRKLVPSADSKFSFDVLTEGNKCLGWLLTFANSSSEDQHSCVDLYFVRQDGTMFQAEHKFRPYFFVAAKDKMEMNVDAYLRGQYQCQIADIQIVEEEDLDFHLKNHLSGLQEETCLLKISFNTVQQLMQVKSDLIKVVERNREAAEGSTTTGQNEDVADCIVDLREYGEPYHVRFAIDNDIRCGLWYNVHVSSDGLTLERDFDHGEYAKIIHVCAFDVKTERFLGGDDDSVVMISYMVDGQAHLIINTECVGRDIKDLKYTLRPSYNLKAPLEVYFTVTNVKNEEELLKSWFAHMIDMKPGIYVTYKDDSAGWPPLKTRATHYGLRIEDELGFQCEDIQGGCRARFPCLLDCFAWVKRDIFRLDGGTDLKAVTRSMFYVPEDASPERMALLRTNDPQMMAYYSVPDAVSMYKIYNELIHHLIFNVTTIIPMTPDEVLHGESSAVCKLLPEKLRLLEELFSSMVTTIDIINPKKKCALFSDICEGVERLGGRKLSRKYFAQMIKLLPGTIETKSTLVRDHNTSCMEPDFEVSLSYKYVEDYHCKVCKTIALHDSFCSNLLFLVGVRARTPGGFDVVHVEEARLPGYDVDEAELPN